MQDLIHAGLLHPPVDLERLYKGKNLTARIEMDGRVSCLGQTYDSLSTSAGMARKSVIGKPPNREYPQTNGWTFWRMRTPSGGLVEVDNYRQRLATGRGGRRRHAA